MGQRFNDKSLQPASSYSRPAQQPEGLQSKLASGRTGTFARGRAHPSAAERDQKEEGSQADHLT